MSRFPLEIENYMSSTLVVISPSQPLSEAIRLMRLHDVRHLPVVTRSKVVGLISQRDIYLMRSLDSTSPSRVMVSEAMASEPYTVEPDEPIDRVAREMVRRRIGTAVVTHGNQLLGLFTTSDALLALAALVEDDRVPGEDDVASVATARRTTTASKATAKAVRKRKSAPRRAKTAR